MPNTLLGLDVSFVSYPPEAIRNQAHLANSVRYVLTQHKRHGVALEQFMEATNIPDILGMRILGDYTRDNLIRALPRLRRATILQWTGLNDLHSTDVPLAGLYDATLSATALSDLGGRSVAAVDARRAMLELLRPRLKRVEQARFLGLAERTLFDLEKRPCNVKLVQATRLQLGYRTLLTNDRSCNPQLR